MSVHPFPRRLRPSTLVEAYFTADRGAEPLVALRPLTALEQMYAYWGSDREVTV